MTRTLQIRDVPEGVHTAVRTRAAQAGLSVSDYLRGVVAEVVALPTMTEVTARARTLARAGGGASAADAVAAVRAGRER